MRAAAGSGFTASRALERRIEDWLGTPLEALVVEHGPAIASAHAERFGRRVVLFAPVYLSSACQNDCTYCGFRRSRRVRRVLLRPDEALVEARSLAARGHRTIDLVAGEVPADRFVDRVADSVARIREGSPIERIHLNLGALSIAQYGRLRAAGATAYHLYQETYDPDVYARVHGAGPKRDMADRLEASRRALAAGFEGIGLGVLLGLAPLAPDLARLVLHARRLLAEFPAARLGFSLPRLRAAGPASGFVPAAPVDDETFAKAFLFLRVEMPDAHMTLTTREPAGLRDALLPLGVTKLSAGVSTAPGGYGVRSDPAVPQFAIRDDRPLEEVVASVRAAGLVPVSS